MHAVTCSNNSKMKMYQIHGHMHIMILNCFRVKVKTACH